MHRFLVLIQGLIRRRLSDQVLGLGLLVFALVLFVLGIYGSAVAGDSEDLEEIRRLGAVAKKKIEQDALNKVELDLGLGFVSGTQDTRGANAAFEVVQGEINLSGALDYEDAEIEGENEQIKNKGHFRAGYEPLIYEHWRGWFFDKVGYDKPQLRDFENQIGAGVKYVWEEDTYRLYAACGPVHHYLRETGAAESVTVNRVMLNPGAWLGLPEYSLEFGASGFYEPRMDSGWSDDYILRGEIWGRYALTRVLGLKLTLADEYRNKVPFGADRNEVSGQMALSIRLK
ncbi:MAG: DUF481 domain-containing protein [Thermodesulfobacteriota bacterium]|nr:DUF481 domain-containing protein [Thermodesulfobacteriota bacterium]